MTKIELAREIARRTPTRIVEISKFNPVTRGSPGMTRAYRKSVNMLTATELLEVEQQRLARTWVK